MNRIPYIVGAVIFLIAAHYHLIGEYNATNASLGMLFVVIGGAFTAFAIERKLP